MTEANDVDDLLAELRIGEQLERLGPVGLKPKSRQIRPIVDFDSPDLSAIDVRDQCVALRGRCSRTATTTSSTLSKAIDGGRPGTLLIDQTVETFNQLLPPLAHTGQTHAQAVATSVFAAPSAHARMILDRIAGTCEDFA